MERNGCLSYLVKSFEKETVRKAALSCSLAIEHDIHTDNDELNNKNNKEGGAQSAIG